MRLSKAQQYMVDLIVWSVALELQDLKEELMATLAEVLAADTELSAEVGQAIQLLQTDTALIQQLQDAINAGNLSPEAQAQVDQLFGEITANRDALAAALSPPAP